MSSSYSDLEKEISLIDWYNYLAERIRLLVWLPIFFGILSLTYSYTITPQFTAKTLIISPSSEERASNQLISRLGSVMGMSMQDNTLTDYVALLRTDFVVDDMIEKFSLNDKWKIDSITKIREKLIGMSNFEISDGNLITISVTDISPNFAADLANGYVDSLKKLLQELSFTNSKVDVDFYESSLAEVQAQFLNIENELKSRTPDVSTIKTNKDALLQDLTRRSQEIRVQQDYVEELKTFMKENSPKLKREIRKLENMQQKNSKNKNYKKNSQYDNYLREYINLEFTLNFLTEQLALSRLKLFKEKNIQTIDKATPPEFKSKPKKALIAIISTVMIFFAIFVYFSSTFFLEFYGSNNPANKVISFGSLIQKIFFIK